MNGIGFALTGVPPATASEDEPFTATFEADNVLK
jgi:hypothetical protein